MPKVSIIVPVYNAVGNIDKCVKSLTGQTLKDIEIILVNDGSKDDSLSVCRKYADSDNRIRVFDKPNGGAASARNLGLDNARGEFICFCDSDDFFSENMCERMYQTATQNGCELVFCDCLKCNSSGSRYIRSFDYRPGLYDGEMLKNEYYPRLIMDDNFDFPPTVSNCVLMIKSELLNDNNIRYNPSHKYCEDEMFGCLCAYYAKSIYYLKGEALYNYEYNDKSTTNTLHIDEWEVFKKICADMSDVFLKSDDFDFSPQLKTLAVFFAAHYVGTLKKSDASPARKKELLKELLSDKVLKSAFKHFKMPKRISKKHMIYLLLMKYSLVGIILRV